MVESDSEDIHRILTFKSHQSIGRVKAFCATSEYHSRLYIYLYEWAEGLVQFRIGSLKANYLMEKLKGKYHLLMTGFANTICPEGHGGAPGIHALAFAKRLMDYNFHPPTNYFPLIVPEALMIEPTETENLQTLDAFADALLKIADEAVTNPELLHNAPHHTPIGRLDEVKAARDLVMCCYFPEGD